MKPRFSSINFQDLDSLEVMREIYYGIFVTRMALEHSNGKGKFNAKEKGALSC